MHLETLLLNQQGEVTYTLANSIKNFNSENTPVLHLFIEQCPAHALTIMKSKNVAQLLPVLAQQSWPRLVKKLPVEERDPLTHLIAEHSKEKIHSDQVIPLHQHMFQTTYLLAKKPQHLLIISLSHISCCRKYQGSECSMSKVLLSMFPLILMMSVNSCGNNTMNSSNLMP